MGLEAQLREILGVSEGEDMLKKVKALKEARESAAQGGVIDLDKVREIVKSAVDDSMAALGKTTRRMEFPEAPADVRAAKHEYGRILKAWRGDIPWTLRSMVLPREVQEAADDAYIVWSLLNQDRRDPVPMKSLKAFHAYDELRKAMDTGTTGEGAEWIPTGFSAALWEKVRLALKVAGLHGRIAMPTDPYKLPIEGADATPYLVAENTEDNGTNAATASTPGTGNVQFDAKKLGVRVFTSGEVEEDSIIPILDYVKGKIVKALVEGIEDATINGDTTATHQDSDVTSAVDHRKAWKGYRKLAISAAKVDLATFSTANLRTLRSKMGKYGVDPNELAWVCSLTTYLTKFLGLTEVVAVDKYGPQATVLTGELAKFDGIPIIVSEKVRENLNASGVYDGVTTTKTQLNLVRRDQFLYGDRRTIKLESDRDIEKDRTVTVASYRGDLQPFNATDALVAVGYNI